MDHNPLPLHQSSVLNKKMALKVIALFMVFSSCCCVDARTRYSTEEDLELEKQLKVLNKLPVKTFKNIAGDKIDCIPINKQPALDHPLLKDHQIQMEPGQLPDDHVPKTSSNTKSEPLEVEFCVEECPVGTVPIQRTRKEDLRTRLQLKGSTPYTNINTNNHVALLRTRAIIAENYFGASATMAVYDLDQYVNNNQSSSVNIWLQSGFDDGDYNLIAAGWMISKSLNGDKRTRLFTNWIGNKGVRGCFNTHCPGFVQVHRSITPDAIIRPTSVYGGQQFEIKITVYKDHKTDNWWFLAGRYKIGYWPKQIFSRMDFSAQLVAFGGAATPDNNALFPPMGSGHKPDGDFHHACYLKDVSYRNINGGIVLPGLDDLEEKVVHPKCYGLMNRKDHGPWRPGYTFYVGGPGGLCLN